MEDLQSTPVSQYADWAPAQEESLVTLPEDEINVEKAEEVGRVINSVEDRLLLEAVAQESEGLKDREAIIRPLTEEEKAIVEGGTCACNDCVESTDSDVDTDMMLIVHDLSERLAALEARIAEYNVRSSHKI